MVGIKLSFGPYSPGRRIESGILDKAKGGSPVAFPQQEPIEIPISDVFDLHCIAPRDVAAAVEAYLEEAYRRGIRALRIIHGKGIGVQREAVRRILGSTPFVTSFGDAPPEAGGWGATIVTLAEKSTGVEE